MSASATDVTIVFRQALTDPHKSTYLLRLYITGATPRSLQAVANIRKICTKYLGDRVELEVIDIYQQPQMAKRDRILTLPTLIRVRPKPVQRLCGDLSDTRQVLDRLDIPEQPQGNCP